jgi:hypothetical protein
VPLTPAIFPGSGTVASESARLTGAGLVAEVFTSGLCRDSSAPGSGVLICNEIGLVAGATVTNIIFNISTASVGTTLAQVCLYDSGFHLLANSTNDTALTETVDFRTKALTTPYAVTTTGLYYVGLLCVAPTTAPALRGLTGSTGAALTRANGSMPGWKQTGLGALPATAVPVATTICLYWALS